MELEIQIIRDPCRELAKQRLRVFGQSGGSIGRAPDSYWALPDPKCYVSGHHCEVEFEDATFWLRDTSRNGVFLNDATERVGYGRKVRLSNGDRMRLGLYELVVRLRDHGLLVGSGAHGGEALAHAGLNHEQAAHTVSLQPPPLHDDAIHPSAVAPAPPADIDNAAVTSVAAASPHTSAWDTERVEPGLATSSTGSHRVVKFHHAELRTLGVLPPEAQERLIANQFRHIKRSLLENAFGKTGPGVVNGRLIMMSSALPGEGKTFSAINLALSMARETDIEVLIVDADVAKPQISGLFHIEKERGLLDALMDEAVDVETFVLRTDVKSLCILPAGRCSEDLATELLASARMEQTVGRLASRYPRRIVLFDSPPLLLTNESRVLATVVGQIVIVVRAGVTPQQAVTEAISFVGEDKPIGLVLNQSKANLPGSYYGYGAYGYGEYGKSPSDRDR